MVTLFDGFRRRLLVRGDSTAPERILVCERPQHLCGATWNTAQMGRTERGMIAFRMLSGVLASIKRGHPERNRLNRIPSTVIRTDAICHLSYDVAVLLFGFVMH